MGVITVLRGFKIPVTILDRFLVAHHAEPTDGDRPIFHRDKPEAASRLLRAKLPAAARDDPNVKVHIIIPYMESELLSTYPYVAYAWALVYAQHEIALAEELPSQARPGFAELRREMLEHTDDGELEALQVRRLG